MKILSIQILREPPSSSQEAVILCQSSSLDHFGYFQRGKVLEVIHFASRLLANRAEMGRNSYEKGDYYNYVNKRTNGLSVVIVTDKEYPPRVAFTLLHKIATDFEEEFTKQHWADKESDDSLQWPQLDDMLQRYQDPHEADDILKIKAELNETKEIVHEALEKLIERGEKMDTLVSRSNDLSYASKLLFTSSADQNSCCIIS